VYPAALRLEPGLEFGQREDYGRSLPVSFIRSPPDLDQKRGEAVGSGLLEIGRTDQGYVRAGGGDVNSGREAPQCERQPSWLAWSRP
jgi:hypothetical protein